MPGFDFDFDFDFDLQAAHTSRERLPRARTEDVVCSAALVVSEDSGMVRDSEEHPPRPFVRGPLPGTRNDASSHLPEGKRIT